MTTILESILMVEKRGMKDRIERLKKINAPEIVIKNDEKYLKDLENGIIKIGGDQELLNIETTGWKVCKGNGGKIFLRFREDVNYYPEAKFGKYISRRKDNE